MVKNLPCNAGYADSIPDQGTKIPHPAEQLSLRALSTEPARHNHNEDPVCYNQGLRQTNKSSNKINIFLKVSPEEWHLLVMKCQIEASIS